MRKIALGVVALSLLASTAAMAQTQMTFADVDTDGDGRLSYSELQAVWPNLTQEEFASADVEGAGLTPEQLTVLQPTTAPAPAPTDGGALAPLPSDGAVPAPTDGGAMAPAPMDPAPSEAAPAEPEPDLQSNTSLSN